MKSSQFIAGLIVLVSVQISTTVFFRHREKVEPSRIEAVRAAEADAARVFARALVSELKHDPDFELRERLIFRATLRAVDDIRRARSSPQHVVMTLAKLDDISPACTAINMKRRAEMPPRPRHDRRASNQNRYDHCKGEQYKHDQRQLGRRLKTGPTLSAEEKLMQALDRQMVPRTLDEIGRNSADYARLLQRANTNQIF